MKVEELAGLLNLEVAAGHNGMGRQVRDGYCGDLLSDVMANAPAESIWLTVQGHQNIVAVALLRELSAIVMVGGNNPDPETQQKADKEGIPLLLSSDSAYDLAGRLYDAGVRGDKKGAN